MTKIELYEKIQRDEKYRGIRWIANVILSCSHSARRLKGLVALVDRGFEVGKVQFTMPYEALYVDGRVVVALPALDTATEDEVSLIPYDPATWFRY